MRNVLIHDTTFAYGGGGTNHQGEHVTFHRLANLRSAAYPGLLITNSLVISVTNNVYYTGANVVSNVNNTGVFQTVGSGSHYLAAGSTNRNAGTTNINPDLLAAIKTRTTFPPLFLSNSITADFTFSPQAQRDIDLPDLGYHFDVLDVVVSGVTINSNVTVTATGGVAIGIDYLHSSWGFILDSARFLSQGSPTLINQIVRAHMVQEASTGNPGTRAMFTDNTDAYGGQPPRLCEGRFRFTAFSQLANDGYLLYSGRGFSELEWTHCSVYNPSLVIDFSGSGTLVCGLTNTLWESGYGLYGLGTTGAGITFHARNNLWRGVNLQFYAGNTNWTVRDNLFDTMAVLSDNGSAVQNWTNAYFNTTYGLTAGVGNTNLASLTYETGPLGKYYQPTNSVLINAGSRTADLAGLYHFTSTANQVAETNSIVDIGLHQIAVNAFGQPIDTDGDGLADHLEDDDGDGIADAGETDWLNYNSFNGLSGSPGLEVFTPLK